MYTLSVGQVLKQSFSVWFRKLPLFVLCAVACYAPLALVGLAFQSDPMAALDSSNGYSWLWGVAGDMSQALLAGVMTYVVVQHARGRPAPLRQCAQLGLSRMCVAMSIGIIVGLITTLGCLLLVVPGIVVHCMLFVAIPASVIEGRGVIDSLRRSRELTNSYKGSVFGVNLALSLLVVFALIAVAVAVHFLANASGSEGLLGLTFAARIVFGSLSAVTMGVTYHHLRLVRDGVDVEQLAAVFE